MQGAPAKSLREINPLPPISIWIEEDQYWLGGREGVRSEEECLGRGRGGYFAKKYLFKVDSLVLDNGAVLS